MESSSATSTAAEVRVQKTDIAFSAPKKFSFPPPLAPTTEIPAAGSSAATSTAAEVRVQKIPSVEKTVALAKAKGMESSSATSTAAEVRVQKTDIAFSAPKKFSFLPPL